MRVLVLAPQPFFQERGTPIAVKLAVETLARTLPKSTLSAPAIDLLTYAEGIDVPIQGVRHLRAPTPRFLYGVRPGISVKKIIHDVFFFIAFVRLLIAERGNQYSVIHAVEESVFMAWLARALLGIPYIYDMDSSLALQLTERWGWASFLQPLFNWFEGLAVRGSVAVAPVCDALEHIALKHGSRHTVLLRDISLLPSSPEGLSPQKLVEQLEHGSPVILYVGNLEPYQGIDLLLEAFALVQEHQSAPHLVVIGGNDASIASYREKAKKLSCETHVSFLGPKPITCLGEYLAGADILVSPRTQGNNTPMKIYSYLHPGKPLVATDLPTHRQVLDESIAVLAAATPASFAAGLKKLLDDKNLRVALGTKARETAESLYTAEAFESQVSFLYEGVVASLKDTAPPPPPPQRAASGGDLV
jgi:glycosyltransferase involved in cell wall biosynthesis